MFYAEEKIKILKQMNAPFFQVSIGVESGSEKILFDVANRRYITGNEPLPTFTEGAILKMPQISSEEITNLRRVFMLYATLTEKYFSLIEQCEKKFYKNRDLYQELVKIRWRSIS